jgi:hypothetical protein
MITILHNGKLYLSQGVVSVLYKEPPDVPLATLSIGFSDGTVAEISNGQATNTLETLEQDFGIRLR